MAAGDAVNGKFVCLCGAARVCFWLQADLHPPEIDFRSGSKAEVQHRPRNVRSWGQSRRQFRAAPCLLVAISRLSALCKSHRTLALRCRRVGAVHCIKSRLSPLLEGGRNRANCDTGGGSRPLHQKRTSALLCLVGCGIPEIPEMFRAWQAYCFVPAGGAVSAPL